MEALEILQRAHENRSKKINKIEKTKELKTPSEAFSQLREYAKAGYDAIPSEDKSVFFKYFGIFDKEKPNGKNHFMLRVRIPAGRLTSNQAKVVGEVAKEFGNNYIDITTRMQIELRYLTIEDLPTVLEKLESVGITTYQTGIDNLRNIVSDPLDGVAFDNVIETFGIVKRLQEIFLKQEEWIGTLPRKFNTAINGSYANRCNVYGHDCCFVLANRDGRYGFRVFLGGKVGVLAQDSGVFLLASEVEHFFEALIKVFKSYGYRDNRNKNRLFFLIQDVGMRNFIKAIEATAGREFLKGGKVLVGIEHSEAEDGAVELKDGSLALHTVVPAGIFDGESMIEASKIAEEVGGEIRLSVDQNLYITGVKAEQKAEILQSKLFKKYHNISTPFFNHMISCAGSETCSFGVIKGKSDAIAMSEALSSYFEGEDDMKIRIYWSACVKGCGIHEMGDVGLLGAKAKLDGKTVEGVDIMLGGSLLKRREAKTIIKSTPLTHAKEHLISLFSEYRRLKKVNESFEEFYERILSRFTHAKVGFYVRLLSYVRVKNIELEFGFDPLIDTLKVEQFEVFELGRKLYYTLTKEEPYSAVEHFQPLLKEKPKDIRKMVNIDENLAELIMRCIHPDETKRAQVFSELLELVIL